MVTGTLKRIFLIFIVLMPLLNFIHEAGHWAGYKLCGVPVTMKFQRVAAERTGNKSAGIIGNWSGPAVNFLIAGMALMYPQQLAVAGLSAASHGLAAQAFGVPL